MDSIPTTILPEAHGFVTEIVKICYTVVQSGVEYTEAEDTVTPEAFAVNEIAGSSFSGEVLWEHSLFIYTFC